MENEESNMFVEDIDVQVIEEPVAEPPEVVKLVRKPRKKKTTKKVPAKKKPKTKPAVKPTTINGKDGARRLVLPKTPSKRPVDLRAKAIGFANLVKQGLFKLRKLK